MNRNYRDLPVIRASAAVEGRESGRLSVTPKDNYISIVAFRVVHGELASVWTWRTSFLK
jgi:hypothetical protein